MSKSQNKQASKPDRKTIGKQLLLYFVIYLILIAVVCFVNIYSFIMTAIFMGFLLIVIDVVRRDSLKTVLLLKIIMMFLLFLCYWLVNR